MGLGAPAYHTTLADKDRPVGRPYADGYPGIIVQRKLGKLEFLNLTCLDEPEPVLDENDERLRCRAPKRSRDGGGRGGGGRDDGGDGGDERDGYGGDAGDHGVRVNDGGDDDGGDDARGDG
ncbi:glycine-rich RNA-binding protein 2-like [Cryptomeria japonica]|uniref:glycine-rich RNA-binding protein 2-like n=1 Tax=Cryptomeria japonica TaxID=3369 RepID=UPI0027D9D2E9|nr:glycine-rich RNA-binding protein 2-like [Cryptomeria japonica]